MKGRTKAWLGLGVLGLLLLGVVYILLFKAMFDAADDGDTARTVAYGVLLIVLAMPSGRRK